MDFQAGIDFGQRDFLAPRDALIFGVLGGYVDANLDYQMGSKFNFAGGQIGGYATYLNNSLFIDTLLNVHLLELGGDDQVPGFPASLDVNNIGLRTDAGYRMRDFKTGAFIEPLATIAVNWADLEGFSLGGNTVSFDDRANVRGRLGLRVGTSYEVQTGIIMEPIVIASAWGNLTGDNRATLSSGGTTFALDDDLNDIWGEVSGGVNVFNPGALIILRQIRRRLWRGPRRLRRQGRYAFWMVSRLAMMSLLAGSGHAAADCNGRSWP